MSRKKWTVGSEQSAVSNRQDRKLHTAKCILQTETSEMLPRGWGETELGQIVLHRKGKKPKSTIQSTKDGCVPYILIDEMEGKPIRSYTDDRTVPIAKEEDILIVWDGSIGKTATGLSGAIGSTIVALTPIVIPSNFLEAFLKLSKPTIEQTSRGTGLQHINQTTFWSLSFPLPPLNEQKRIVAKLDQILPRIDAVKERLDKVPAIVKRFRQSVLTAAVTGKLTEKWRENNLDVVAPHSLSLIPEKLSNSYLNIFEETKVFIIPATWIYSPIYNLGEIKGGGTPSKANPDFWKGEIPWISPKDMKVDRISSGIDFISQEAINQSSTKLIPKSSILFVVRGMILIHTFPVAITLKELTINQDMKALLPNKKVEPEYLLIVFKQIGSKVLTYIKEATHGTLRLELPLLQTFAIPVPPLEEQKEIVRQVDKLFALADRLESHYKKAKAIVGAVREPSLLSQSLLAKAFRGELVITEAELAEKEGRDFESAEELLERILQEKSKLGRGGSRTAPTINRKPLGRLIGEKAKKK